ncbi:MAG: hypothetical protein Q7R47_04085 [Candidatus Diapherotrites archaeon]|nr:hypothetical protein [Candidatus Diapherotrites archaeon]
MFREFLRLLFSLVRSPWLLLVAVVGVAINLGILAVIQEPVLVILTDLTYGPTMAEGGGGLFFIQTYGTEIGIILLGVLVTGMVNAWVGLALARFASRQQERHSEVLESIRYALKKTGLVAAWGLFVWVLALTAAVLFVVVLALGNVSWILFWPALLVWLVGVLLAGLVVGLAIPVMGIEDVSIKEGLKKSSAFVRSQVLGFIAFLAVLSIVLLVITEIGSRLAEAVEDETIAFLVTVVFLLVQVVCANLAVPFYFLTEKSKHK